MWPRSRGTDEAQQDTIRQIVMAREAMILGTYPSKTVMSGQSGLGLHGRKKAEVRHSISAERFVHMVLILRDVILCTGERLCLLESKLNYRRGGDGRLDSILVSTSTSLPMAFGPSAGVGHWRAADPQRLAVDLNQGNSGR
jgi:hypothetical protein